MGGAALGRPQVARDPQLCAPSPSREHACGCPYDFCGQKPRYRIAFFSSPSCRARGVPLHAVDLTPSSTCVRRYREFFALDKSLDSTLPESVQLPEFPSKSTFGRMSPSLVRSRRMELERYLRALLADADICALEQVRLFCKMPEGCHEPQVVVEPCLDAIPEKCTSSMAACTSLCLHVCIHACTYVCMYACMHACMYLCVYV